MFSQEGPGLHQGHTHVPPLEGRQQEMWPDISEPGRRPSIWPRCEEGSGGPDRRWKAVGHRYARGFTIWKLPCLWSHSTFGTFRRVDHILFHPSEWGGAWRWWCLHGEKMPCVVVLKCSGLAPCPRSLGRVSSYSLSARLSTRVIGICTAIQADLQKTTTKLTSSINTQNVWKIL